MGGQAVYQARTLLKLGIDSTIFDDEQACLAFGIQWRRGNEETQFKLYPNPSCEGQFSLDWDKKLDGMGKVEIFDIMGRLVEIKELDLGLKQTRIKTKLMISGAYIVRVRNDLGAILFIGKAVICD